MKQKTIKILLKTLLFLPFWVIAYFFYFSLDSEFGNDLKVFQVGALILLALISAFGTIFWNLFDYEKYDDIEEKDFLVSRHIISIENTAKNWEIINEILACQIVSVRVIQKADDFIKARISQKLIDSFLTIEKKQTRIELKIEKKNFAFLPDNAINYGILRKLVKSLGVESQVFSKELS